MQLRVLPCNWGVARPDYIETLLKDVASDLNRLLRTPFEEIIHVRSLPLDADPYTPYVEWRDPPDEPFVIWLAGRDPDGGDLDWCKYAYQFSHEFCHVLSDYNRLKDNPNNWFHESICELASVFTLRCMAKRWSARPLPPNKVSYAQALKKYSQKRLSRLVVQLREGVTLRAWLSFYEDALRKCEYQRQKNDLVAYALLPIFESTPEGWNAIRSFPNCTGSLEEYFTAWHSSVDPVGKTFVARLSNAFDYTIG